MLRVVRIVDRATLETTLARSIAVGFSASLKHGHKTKIAHEKINSKAENTAEGSKAQDRAWKENQEAALRLLFRRW
jgi:hypothetical protein